MAYVEIDDAGEIVTNEDGERNVIENLGGWDTVREMIPEDFKDEKLWDNIPDTQTLLKNYAHAQKRMGSAVNLPGDDPDERNEFYSKLGRPDSPEDYLVEFPELPEGNYWDKQAQTGFLAAAHNAGLNDGQVKEILGWYGEWQKDTNLDAGRVMGEVAEGLKKEWGPMYDENIARTQRAVQEIGGVELQNVLDSTGIGNNPTLIRAFNRVGKMLQEDGIIPDNITEIGTSSQATEKIAGILNDKEHPYHKGDQRAVDEVNKLYEIAYSA
jgi:hypothetical protein